MPAAGAEVILQPKVPITISGGAKAEFNNIKFDSSKLTELANWYEHLIYASDANANNRLVLEGCEMYGFNLNKSAIYCSSSNKLKSVSINNCYFHDMKKSCFFSEGTSVDAFTLTNSTIANISTNSESYWAGIFDPRGSSVVVTVDHCTFYNCQAMNTDYAAVKTVSASTSNVVSNCIFMMPESYSSSRAVHFADEAKGNIKNCLTYNYTASTNGIRNGGATKANCLNDDPLFADAANNDFTLGALSPARTAGVESKPIGDPRWYE